MSLANNEFYYLLSDLHAYNLFSLSYWTAHILQYNRTYDSGNSSLIPDFKGNASCIYPVRILFVQFF